MFKISHGLLEFPTASTFAHPNHKVLRGHAYKFHKQRGCTRRRRFAFTIPAVPFWNKLSAEIVNASSVKSFKELVQINNREQAEESQATPMTLYFCCGWTRWSAILKWCAVGENQKFIVPWSSFLAVQFSTVVSFACYIS